MLLDQIHLTHSVYLNELNMHQYINAHIELSNTTETGRSQKSGKLQYIYV